MYLSRFRSTERKIVLSLVNLIQNPDHKFTGRGGVQAAVGQRGDGRAQRPVAPQVSKAPRSR